MIPAIFCMHANENPAVCRCSDDCYCKTHTCRERRNTMANPTIVCLCGSTRFHKQFVRANYEETMAGKIVLSVGFYPHGDHGESLGCTSEQKKMLDVLHLRKIDLADEVLVLNVDGYIGESTKNEIFHAWVHNKRIRWAEPDKAIDIRAEYEKHLLETRSK